MRDAHRYFTSYKSLPGPLFAPGGPSPHDVRQGEVGSCWLLAAMAATAQQAPDVIRGMFEPVGASEYRVTFHDGERGPVHVDVTTEVPFRWFSSGPLYADAKNATWVSVLEKAYAKAFEPRDGYEAIGGDHPRLALARITGWPVRDYDIDGDLSQPSKAAEGDELLTAYQLGYPMVAGSRIAQVRADVVPMHAYAVTSIEGDAGGVQLISLFDPEGLNAYPNSELRLTLEELVSYFYYVSMAQPPRNVE